MTAYCKKCILNESTPGVNLDSDQICNFCSRTVQREDYSGLRRIMMDYRDFEAHVKDSSGGYDCMLMYSGGEEGTYLLSRLITKDCLKPLVFTINHPFKSRDSLENIQEIIRKLNADHVIFSFDPRAYKKLMKYVFLRGSEENSLLKPVANKAPCITCAGYLQIKAFLYARRMGIPYMLCVDTEQTSILPPDIGKVFEMLSAIYGQDLMESLFEKEEMEALKGGDGGCGIPKIIYPLSAKSFRRDEILQELKAMGLQGLSSIRSECLLHSLLDYYSFKRYNTCYYSPQVAEAVRSGKCDRDEEIAFVSDYRNIIHIASKESISNGEKNYIKRRLEKHSEGSPIKYEGSIRNILSLKDMAKELDLDIDDI